MNPVVDRLEEDRLARLQALEVASFIVEAPAGAGKTELLTQRYLRLLAVVEHPEEVLALTFTNKAATEMRDRILGSLERAAGGEVPDQPHKRQTFDLAQGVLARDREQGWGLLGHPGRLRITTIDALCASLARQMPYLSRFGAQPGVAEDAASHYATAARRTLEMVESDGPDAEVVAAALAFMDNNAGRLEKLLVSMLARRDQWLQHAAQIESGEMKAEVEAGFAALIERDLASVAALLDGRMQSLLMPLARFAAANVPGQFDPLFDWFFGLTAALDDLPRWQALAGFLLTGTGTLRKTVDKRLGFPAEKEFAEQKKAMLDVLAELRGVAGLEEALGMLSGLPQPELSEGEWASVENFSRLLRLAAGQLWLAFQEAGEVDFIEIAARAGLALGDDEAPTDLAQALDYRIRHLLVDEFQDTSPSQVGLIERLTRGWMPDDGRTLFVVGDPMQSIYRFRKADVGLFLRVRERGIGDIRLDHLRLFRNNRSFPGIVDWVNSAFPSIFPPADGPETGAVRYAESAATRPPHADSGVSVHPLLRLDEDAAEAEGRCVLDLILKARRTYPEERVAVLVRARSHLDALVAEIRRSAPDLRFQAVDIEGLDGRQHVQDLLTLFRALHHRADRVHWLALLRAPWCGLLLADLHQLAADDKRSTLWQLMQDEARVARLSDDGQQRLRHVRGVLAEAFARRGRQHPRRWLEGVWLMLGGPACLEVPEAMADVEAFFSLVDKLVAARNLSAATLAEHAAELFAPADPLGAAVQMMTIHKSKGLEFETVILPGLHRSTGGNDSSLLLWDEVAGADGDEHLLVAPIKARGQGAGQPTPYDYLKKLEAERNAHEDERLLYVAATRAIRRLHLVGVAVPDEKKEDGLKPPATGTLLKLLWAGVAQPVFAAALGSAGATGSAPPAFDSASFVPPLLRLKQVGLPAALRASPPDCAPSDNAPLALDEAESVLSLEASVGTLVHRCLELIAGQGLKNWSPERVTGLEKAWGRWLENQGHASVEATAGAAEAVAAVCATLRSDSGRWVLADHPGAAAEQAWSSMVAGVTVHHIIDRVFVADGCRWIIDYKTVRAPLAELPQRAAGFRPQLERYAGLFAGEALPLRLAIYFPIQACLLELDP